MASTIVLKKTFRMIYLLFTAYSDNINTDCAMGGNKIVQVNATITLILINMNNSKDDN